MQRKHNAQKRSQRLKPDNNKPERRKEEDPLYFGYFALEGMERRWYATKRRFGMKIRTEIIRDFDEIMRDLAIVLEKLGSRWIGEDWLPC